VEGATHDREVDWVDGRGSDGDPDLIGSGLDDGHVDDLDRVRASRRADDRGAKVEMLTALFLLACVRPLFT